MIPPVQPLGIDNLFFQVSDLAAAISFYERCGLRLKFRLDDKQMALFEIGQETPGLVLTVGTGPAAGRLWLEVGDADGVAAAMTAAGVAVRSFDTATGRTVEVTDADGNVLGFADYRHRPDLARTAT